MLLGFFDRQHHVAKFTGYGRGGWRPGSPKACGSSPAGCRAPWVQTTVAFSTAREHARQNLNDGLMFGNLPTPSDATRMWRWERGDGGWSREFTGADPEWLEPVMTPECKRTF